MPQVTWLSSEIHREFVEAMDAVLAHPNVVAVRWSQYTPGFNDGEPCTFDGHSPEVRLTGFPKIDEEAELELESGDYLGEDEEGTWLSEYDLYEYRNEAGERDYRNGSRVYEVGGLDTTEISKLLGDFEGVVTSGAHDVWMNTNFGDPAQVVATTEGFEVEYYECGY
ncbi:hypothetical protein HWB79_gp159 [Streptomyces phage LukeCage]|jgi:hypothetical protein|uniref:Uncharacterized protein n=1 Tax=Streptomyces phage LukeCage TaxID=2283304 RepID=A0A345MGH1_9CAUD|nr:hypothetical protein HWB79_gp159 [Streptomyces phage LukeCage]AXH69652.1 hypothetical protein SEA_LUKECAGE_137 [Streptomyces phage LukeCage]